MTTSIDVKVANEIGALRLELLRRDVLLEQNAEQIASLQTELAKLKALNRRSSVGGPPVHDETEPKQAAE